MPVIPALWEPRQEQIALVREPAWAMWQNPISTKNTKKSDVVAHEIQKN